MQDVLLLDSLRGSWDSSDVSLYYNNLLANSTSAAANGLTAHQRQQLDPAYKSVLPGLHLRQPDACNGIAWAFDGIAWALDGIAWYPTCVDM